MPQRGDVRLSSYPAGRIEVFKDGKWGTVCGHYTWNNHHAAEVVCRRLGYRGGRTYKVSNSPNDLPIIVGWRICSGGEENLLECPLQDERTEANETGDCSHDIDVGASCTGASAQPPAENDPWEAIAPAQWKMSASGGAPLGIAIGESWLRMQSTAAV